MIWKHFSSFKNNKNTFLKHFSCLRNEKHIFETFFIFAKWKTYFRSSLHVYEMENRLLKRFSSLQNENMFSILKLSLFQKKRTLQKHVRSFIGISFCNCKKQFKNVLFYFVSLKTGYKTCFFIFVKTKDASKLLWFFLQKQRTLQKYVFQF